MLTFLSNINPVGHGDVNGNKLGSNQKTTDKYAAER